MMGSGHYRNTKATEPIISLRWAFLLKVVENIRPHWLNYILTNRTLRLDAITQTFNTAAGTWTLQLQTMPVN